MFIHRPAVDSLILVEVPSSLVRYYPYGTNRPGSGHPLTDYRFTGQRQEAALGLYDYGARFYDPLLGRFLSADTVVPEPGNPQALNRYAYVLNNPLRYTDPTGRLPEASVSGEPVPYEPPPLPLQLVFIKEFITEVLSHSPGNVGMSMQAQSGEKKLFDFQFGGWIVRTKLQVKVGQSIRTANPNTSLYVEPERWQVEFPFGRQGKYYVQTQWKQGDIPRLAQGFYKEQTYQDPEGKFVKVKTVSSASFPMPSFGYGADTQTALVYEHGLSGGVKGQWTVSLSLQFEVNSIELGTTAAALVLLLYGYPGLVSNPGLQSAY